MYYLCKLHHQDPHSEFMHFVYDTLDSTCCYCTPYEVKLIRDEFSRRGKDYDEILGFSKSKWFKYKTLFNGKTVNYCKWNTYDGVNCFVAVDYRENFPQVMLTILDRRDTARPFYRTTSRFYAGDSIRHYMLISYEFFVCMLNHDLDSFLTLFHELTFVSYGEDWELTYDKSDINFF